MTGLPCLGDPQHKGVGVSEFHRSTASPVFWCSVVTMVTVCHFFGTRRGIFSHVECGRTLGNAVHFFLSGENRYQIWTLEQLELSLYANMPYYAIMPSYNDATCFGTICTFNQRALVLFSNGLRTKPPCSTVFIRVPLLPVVRVPQFTCTMVKAWYMGFGHDSHSHHSHPTIIYYY